MTRIIINGVNGHMGRVVKELAEADASVSIAAGVDIADDGSNPFPVFTDITECDVEADVVVDFSNPKAMSGLYSFCRDKGVGLVLCTTGLSEEQIAEAAELSKEVPVLRSANMSLGINALLELLDRAARVFGPAGYDVEILERHHDQKLDAPSGTALALADTLRDALKETVSEDYDYVYDRSLRNEKRPKYEIGISAMRGGNIVGEHEVMFAGVDEVISFNHRATSKAVFGKGAVEAAKFLAERPAGMYDMQDVIKNA